MEDPMKRTERKQESKQAPKKALPVTWKSRYLRQNRWISGLAALIGMLAVLHLSVAVLVDCLQILNILLAVIHSVLFGALLFATVSTRSNEDEDTNIPIDHDTGGG